MLKKQVLLDPEKSSSKTCVFDTIPHAARVEENIAAMIHKVKSTTSVDSTYQLQPLSGQLATAEQEKDLLSFWEIGSHHFENKVKYFILKDPSANVPQRQAKLLTYTISKTGRKKIKND